MNRRRQQKTLLLSFCACVLLTACSDPSPAPNASSSERPSSTHSPTSEPELIPEGSAEENLPYFDAVNRRVVEEDPDATGMTFIDALTEAGFPRDDMEVTDDYSTVGNRAESIQFSVRWGDECLIGQNGSSVDGYHSVVMDVLASGQCLVGNTRDIDS
ncbi:DUF6993 domain-containing protein [Paramicrobacterium sp. CJ85]|uniref:DUF6993 domain-containing protein n=1 Tax=Paramicrobacterium sp. CJ85 TaxID=3445355 RepID=UPI003F621B64